MTTGADIATAFRAVFGTDLPDDTPIGHIPDDPRISAYEDWRDEPIEGSEADRLDRIYETQLEGTWFG